MPEDDHSRPAYWPIAGDRLFIRSYWRPATEIAAFSGDPFRMKDDFKDLADFLVDFNEEHAQEGCNLAWPIVFCYRQYIEVALREVVVKYWRYAKYARLVEPDLDTHSVYQLWSFYKLVILSVIQDVIEEISFMEKCINELEAIDAGSCTFKDSTGKDGPPVDIPLDFIDPFHLRNVMDHIHAFISSSETVLASYANGEI